MSRFPVRSIDVGYGNTKFVLREDGDGIHCDLFPSLAPIASSVQGLDGGILAKHRIVPIEIDGLRYGVGKDSNLSLQGVNARTLDATFSQSNEYLALVRGALLYMGATEITLLVVGLPVTTALTMGPALEKRLTGTHVLSESGGSRKVVNVHRVKALAQPLGAFIDYATRTGRGEQMPGCYGDYAQSSGRAHVRAG